MAENHDIPRIVDDCPHNLPVALNEDAGAYRILALKLDTSQYGGARKGVVELIKRMFDNDTIFSILSSARGGSLPAMGLLLHLSHTQCTTIAKFKSYVDPREIPQAFALIDQCIRNGIPSNTLLQDVDYSSLEEIEKCLSEKPGTPKNLQVTWKNVAEKAKLTKQTIDNLDAPRDRAREDVSLTEEMLTVLTAKSPDFTVAELIIQLRAIGREDVVKDINLFRKCRTTCFKESQNEEDQMDLC